MNRSDPLGYYRVLDIAPTASAAEIKAAFRRKAMAYHPDRCKAPNATMLFQEVNTAFSVLGDAGSRARYDTSTLETTKREAPTSPIVCSRCNKVTAQPRYAIFYRVVSLVLVWRQPVQGIFCSACAEKEALKATAITWVFGWWGFPWGPIYTIGALITNLEGGEQPKDINARLLAHQAWYFASVGQMDVARAVAEQALAIALRIKSGHNTDAAKLRSQLDAFIASLPVGSTTSQMKNLWTGFRRPHFLQLIPLVVALCFLFYDRFPQAQDISQNDTPVVGTPDTFTPQPEPAPASTPTTKPYTTNPPEEPTSDNAASPRELMDDSYMDGPASAASEPASSAEKLLPFEAMQGSPYTRPALAPNGKPWPLLAGYIAGLPRRNLDGYSQVTVDNGLNDVDMFVKLTSVSGPMAYPVRQFFIPAHGSFIVHQLRAGDYDIRFMNLGSGIKSGSPPFALTQTRKENGVEYSNYELTLYAVPNGNVKMRPLSNDEF